MQEDTLHLLPIVILRTFFWQQHPLMENVKGLSVAFAEPKDAEEHDCPSIGSCIVSKILKVDLPANDLSKMFTY